MAITLANIRDASKALADMANDDFISDSDWNSMINETTRELHLLVSTAEDTFFTTVDFTISSGNTYSLPTTFMRVKGLDIDPGTNSARNVPKYNFNERNNQSSGWWSQDRFYRVMGRTLYIEPSDNATGDYRLYYVPAPTTLTASVDLDVALEPYHEFIIRGVAIKALLKDERDASALMALQQQAREDIKNSVQVDESEPDCIIDVENSGPRWPLA